ncbi:MAG: hypothetical protein ACKOFG_07645 [Limnohabitans sp.]
MKRRTALLVLAVVTVTVSLSHLELQQVDERWLLHVDGRPVDLAGGLAEWRNRRVRDCRQVQALAPEDPRSALALQALQAHSPPDSLSAAITGLWARGDWMLASVRFASLHPALVLLRQAPQGWQVVQGGVWSGSTHPFHPGPFIRRYLQDRVPEAPADLLACHADLQEV